MGLILVCFCLFQIPMFNQLTHRRVTAEYFEEPSFRGCISQMFGVVKENLQCILLLKNFILIDLLVLRVEQQYKFNIVWKRKLGNNEITSCV